MFALFGFNEPNGLSKRALKEVEKTFAMADFTLEPITVTDETNALLPSIITGNNLFLVQGKGSVLGYVFVDQAPSKTAKFDYLVVFDGNLKVINTKVLVYREEYGGEIGSKRWLKQFIGKSGSDRVKAGENIDVISGATISVNSMTLAMDKLLQTIQILKEKDQI
ncbi:MAG: FMN-binding protein [Muricauda sp.]|jgi:Na+-translocating ferredoxin:NAD+ oxidoreductase RnfG subunit|nr:FMN-binding protein [Allomuricauda sp.]